MVKVCKGLDYGTPDNAITVIECKKTKQNKIELSSDDLSTAFDAIRR